MVASTGEWRNSSTSGSSSGGPAVDTERSTGLGGAKNCSGSGWNAAASSPKPTGNIKPAGARVAGGAVRELSAGGCTLPVLATATSEADAADRARGGCNAAGLLPLPACAAAGMALATGGIGSPAGCQPLPGAGRPLVRLPIAEKGGPGPREDTITLSAAGGDIARAGTALAAGLSCTIGHGMSLVPCSCEPDEAGRPPSPLSCADSLIERSSSEAESLSAAGSGNAKPGAVALDVRW